MLVFGFGVFARCARWIYRRRFGNRCGFHLHWSYSWPVKTGPTAVSETSSVNSHRTPCKTPPNQQDYGYCKKNSDPKHKSIFFRPFLQAWRTAKRSADNFWSGVTCYETRHRKRPYIYAFRAKRNKLLPAGCRLVNCRRHLIQKHNTLETNHQALENQHTILFVWKHGSKDDGCQWRTVEANTYLKQKKNQCHKQ